MILPYGKYSRMSKSKIENRNKLMRTQLSESFFFRDFIYSETAAIMGLDNIPEDFDLAVQAGRNLCEKLLEPIQSHWGRIHIRSAYRSETVNGIGNELKAACARNHKNYAGHIWDKRDKDGFMGATACIVIPKYLPHYAETGDWTSLAWWVHEHIPTYNLLQFFPALCAFNITWHEDPTKPKKIQSFIPDPLTGHSKSIYQNGQISAPYQKMPPQQRYRACEQILRKKG